MNRGRTEVKSKPRYIKHLKPLLRESILQSLSDMAVYNSFLYIYQVYSIQLNPIRFVQPKSIVVSIILRVFE